MTLRGINDQCAALQSKINKKIELLGTYQTYKVFLDDLRPKEVKEKEALARAEKLEARERDRAQARSMDATAGGQRRGTRIDPSRSLAAQSRAANAAHAHNEADAMAAAQFEVEYPDNLKQLFEDDSSDHSYEKPFDNAEELQNHFVELEESNLSLIQQW